MKPDELAKIKREAEFILEYNEQYEVFDTAKDNDQRNLIALCAEVEALQKRVKQAECQHSWAQYGGCELCGYGAEIIDD